MVDNLALLIAHVMIVIVLYRSFMYPDDDRPVANEPTRAEDDATGVKLKPRLGRKNAAR
jgi:hypothetical protein